MKSRVFNLEFNPLDIFVTVDEVYEAYKNVFPINTQSIYILDIGEWIILMDDGKVVGLCMLETYPSGKVCLYSFGIISEYRRKGLGTKFFKFVSSLVDKPALFVSAQTPDMKEFYTKAGATFLSDKAEDYDGNPMYQWQTSSS